MTSILCMLGMIILEGTCIGKYISPPILTIQYDVELILLAIIFVTVHYFIFDRIDMNDIYGYIVGAFEIILSSFMLYVLYFPNLFLNVKYYDCIGATVVQFVIILGRVYFLRKRGRKTKATSCDS